MYIGALGNGTDPRDSIYTILKEVLDNSVDEFTTGFGKNIIVDVDEKTATVRDFDQGIPLGSVIKAGHLYILETPLFRVKTKKRNRYCYSQEERDAAVAEFSKEKVEITRFKGLGEINEKKFGLEHCRMFLCHSYLSILCLTGVVLLPPNSIGFDSLSLRELRHIGRMYLNNALRNFNLYPYVF